MRNEQGAQSTLSTVQQNGGNGEICQFDVREPEMASQAVADIISRHQRLDILINNAGIIADGLFMTMSPENWHRVIDTSLHGFFNLTRLPAVKERLKRGDASVLMEQDGFQPLGKIPAVPPVCPPPKYIAKILVDCPGRTVQANVNNISLHEFDNTRLAEVISGGLRDGTNSLTLNFSDSPNGKKSAVLVEVYIMPEIPGHLPARAFSYFVPPQAHPKSGPVLINVTPELLKTMEPKNSSPKAAAGK